VGTQKIRIGAREVERPEVISCKLGLAFRRERHGTQICMRIGLELLPMIGFVLHVKEHAVDLVRFRTRHQQPPVPAHRVAYCEVEVIGLVCHSRSADETAPFVAKRRAYV
jgi:hypothetical protein